MTENEAIDVLKKDSCYECSQGTDSAVNCEYGACSVAMATRLAIQAIEEVQKYHAIGTAEEIQQKMAELEQYRGMGSTPSQIYVRMGGYISELAKYAEIGTAEECREAVEKQRAKNCKQ